MHEDRCNFFATERQLHAKTFNPCQKSVKVQIQSEKPSVPDVYCVVGCVRMQQTPIEHRDLGLGHRQVLPIHKSDSMGVAPMVDVMLIDC
ncbi:hypothetical protein ACVW16_004992 [Bradyrhizobium sp. USDA 4474]